MKERPIAFFWTGLIAGFIGISFRFLGSPEFAIIGLTWAVGPLFFMATVAGIAITGARPYLKLDFLRYLVALVLCTITYGLALITFFAVVGFSPDWLGVGASANIVQFGIDVWLGLLAAGAVGATGISLFAALLTRKWGTPLLLRLMVAGLLVICLTFVANLPFHRDWSFLGVLFPSGNALFCYLVGTHIWQQAEI